MVMLIGKQKKMDVELRMEMKYKMRNVRLMGRQKL